MPCKAVRQRHALNLASAKGRVKFIRGLLEDGGGNLLAGVVIEEDNADGPFTHGETFYTGFFPATSGRGPRVSEHFEVV